jgi:hypothetical protein
MKKNLCFKNDVDDTLKLEIELKTKIVTDKTNKTQEQQVGTIDLYPKKI